MTPKPGQSSAGMQALSATRQRGARSLLAPLRLNCVHRRMETGDLIWVSDTLFLGNHQPASLNLLPKDMQAMIIIIIIILTIITKTIKATNL